MVKAIEYDNDYVKFIDQTLLPNRLDHIRTSDYRIIVSAIKQLKIRGAPLIGIAAAYGVVLAAKEGIEKTLLEQKEWLADVIDEIESSRPTARNLFVALDRMKKLIKCSKDKNSADLWETLREEAKNIIDEDRELCDNIGENGAKLIGDGDAIITHCNTGALVTGGIGTALGVIYTAHKQNKNVYVFANETRPLLQGARLTAWECLQLGIPASLICDSAAASVLAKQEIQCAMVGADRIAPNGDVANKIGTYALALACKAHNIPFYVAAPYTTFDFTISSGAEIPIEERNKDELVKLSGIRIAPEKINVYNPAFDVTPASLVSAIITDSGIFHAPYGKWDGLKKEK